MNAFTSTDVAQWVDGRVIGASDVVLHGLAQIDEAQTGDLTFVGDKAYVDRWPASSASAAIVEQDMILEPGSDRALIVVNNADLAMAKVLDHLAPPPVGPPLGVHATAVVADDAHIGEGVAIGPFCMVGPRARIEPGAVLHAHVTVLDDAVIGAKTVLWPGVVVRERCTIGERCVLEPHVVLGADGFGYRADHSGPAPRIVKVPHLGHVELGDDVELGANTTVDRGKFGPTTIGHGSKLDNQCQVGHNSRIGRMVMISGCTAIAGSVVIGDGVQIGGCSSFKDHIHIGAGARIAGMSAVIHDVPAGAKWAGFPAQDSRHFFREISAVQKLPALLKKVKPLLEALESENA
ncbi:MAG: UDP-3-O-(3-hydroxymyristoyl)glucosamine N-acyltransferase [Algisphaera sp.]